MSTVLITGAPKSGKSEFINQMLGQRLLATSELSVPYANWVTRGTRLERFLLQDGVRTRLSEERYFELMENPPASLVFGTWVQSYLPFPTDLIRAAIFETSLEDALPEEVGSASSVVILLPEHGIDRPTYLPLLGFLRKLRQTATCQRVVLTQIPSQVDNRVAVARHEQLKELVRASGVKLINHGWKDAIRYAKGS